MHRAAPCCRSTPHTPVRDGLQCGLRRDPLAFLNSSPAVHQGFGRDAAPAHNMHAVRAMISIVVLIVLIVSFLRTQWLLATSWALLSFGGMAVVPVEMTGGVSILGQSVAALLLFVKVASGPYGISNSLAVAIDLRRLGLLTAFTLVAICGALILPRVFAGVAYVYPMRIVTDAEGAELIAPGTANLTQSLYLASSLLVAVAYAQLAQRQSFIDDIGRAFLVGATVFVATGLLDIVATTLGATYVLETFRTASYAFLVGDEIASVRRIVGLMPEASSFGMLGAFWLSILLFARDIFPDRCRSFVVPLLAGACAILAVLSLSSTAYAMLSVILGLYVAGAALRLISPDHRSRRVAFRQLSVIVAFALATTITMLFHERMAETVSMVLDELVFQKRLSDSYENRSAWTLAAWNAWTATHGLGVGLGTARTSNFLINVLASTGALGFLLFVSYLVVFLTSSAPPRPKTSALVSAMKITAVPVIVGLTVAGTTPDYGVGLGAMFGIVAGIACIKKRRTEPRHGPELLDASSR